MTHLKSARAVTRYSWPPGALAWPGRGPITRMARIERPAVQARVEPVASRLDALLHAEMALIAKSLQFAEPERIRVGVVTPWQNMIDRRARRVGATRLAHSAQRLNPALVAAPLLPTVGVVGRQRHLAKPRQGFIAGGAPLKHTKDAAFCRASGARTSRSTRRGGCGFLLPALSREVRRQALTWPPTRRKKRPRRRIGRGLHSSYIAARILPRPPHGRKELRPCTHRRARARSVCPTNNSHR
jgi:hypothetical protein